MAKVRIFVANQLPPGVVGMQGVGVVPRIVHHLGTTVIVGCHDEGNVLGKLHEPLRLKLVFFVVGVWTTVWVRVVAVHVDAIGIFACGMVYRVVAAIVGAVGVGVWGDVKVDVVHDGLHLWLVLVFE